MSNSYYLLSGHDGRSVWMAGVYGWLLKEWPHRQDLRKGLTVRMRQEADFRAKERVCLSNIIVW